MRMFKKLQIIIPFTDALAQMPKYEKFMNEILMNKRKLEEDETMRRSDECSIILLNKLPPNLKDQGVFLYLAQ